MILSRSIQDLYDNTSVDNNTKVYYIDDSTNDLSDFEDYVTKNIGVIGEGLPAQDVIDKLDEITSFGVPAEIFLMDSYPSRDDFDDLIAKARDYYDTEYIEEEDIPPLRYFKKVINKGRPRPMVKFKVNRCRGPPN